MAEVVSVIAFKFSKQELEDLLDAVCFRHKALREKNFKNMPSYIKVELGRERDNQAAMARILADYIGITKERIEFFLKTGSSHE